MLLRCDVTGVWHHWVWDITVVRLLCFMKACGPSLMMGVDRHVARPVKWPWQEVSRRICVWAVVQSVVYKMRSFVVYSAFQVTANTWNHWNLGDKVKPDLLYKPPGGWSVLKWISPSHFILVDSNYAIVSIFPSIMAEELFVFLESLELKILKTFIKIYCRRKSDFLSTTTIEGEIFSLFG